MRVTSTMRVARILTAVCIFATAPFALAQKYAAPEGGWAYTFEGDAAEDGLDPFTSLDGTWDHNNGSDQWDGSAIGEGNPGGVSVLSEGDTGFIRIQDPGDPRDYDFPDPGSNRKVYFTHNLIDDLNEDPGLNSIIDDGVTLYFRARVATAATGPVDDYHPDGGAGISEWPAEGRGYFQHDSGKSMIAIKQTDGANVAFGLNYGEASFHPDVFNGDSDQQGLILPHLLFGDFIAGNAGEIGLSDGSQDADPDEYNFDYVANEEGQIVPVSDITQWQEFWITIEAGSIATNPSFPDELDGTHKVNIYSGTADDPVAASEFYISAAQGSDYVDGEEESYIAIGAGATPQAGAFDIDFFSWAPGIHTPMLGGVGPVCNPDTGGDLDGNGTVEFADFLILSGNFGNAVGSHADGDIDCNGTVEFADFLVLSGNFGNSVGGAESVPEPSSALIVMSGVLLLLTRRKQRN